MPSLTSHTATLSYDECGQGFPLLTFAPAGLQSPLVVWSRPSAPVNPTAAFAKDVRGIAMEPRNAGGQSRAPLTAQDSWPTYAADHLALLAHLGIAQCHLDGQGIGGPFSFSMRKAQPQRSASAVIAQTSGRVGPMPSRRSANVAAWAQALQDHPEATEQVLEAFNQHLYGPGFVYSVDRAFVARCQTPCLVLAGNDAAHLFAISEEVAQLLPHAECIPEWKDGAPLASAQVRMQQFLMEHTPVRA